MNAVVSPPNHVVTREEWLDARRELLKLEKEHTHLRDRIRAERLALPWVRVEKDYVFDRLEGRKTLAELFDGRSQLLIYHFMLGPDWDAGCTSCSFVADHFEGALPHLNHHDVTLIAVSQAPIEKITAYKDRLGWKFPWASSFGSDFNFDYHVSFTKEDLAKDEVFYNFEAIPPAEAHDELPGLSAFYRNDRDEVFHTYSSYSRGFEEIMGTLMILDRAPFGRNEGSAMDFVKRRDEYAPESQASSGCH